MPNPALELDMARYKLKIERKFAESYVNHTFVMPRIKPPPQRHSEAGIRIDPETAFAFTNRCNSQLYPTELTNDSRLIGTIKSPSSSSKLDLVSKKTMQTRENT